MIELTEQQQREIAASGWPPHVVNPQTRESYVLLHEEMYKRVRAILEEEDEISAVEEMHPLTSETVE